MSHASRLLTTETGFGFEGQLHGIRIVKAVVHVTNPILIFKEVAAEAGFRDTGELDRQFNRAFRIKPSALRRATLLKSPLVWFEHDPIARTV